MYKNSSAAENNNVSFLDFFELPKELLGTVELADAFSLRPAVSDMTTMRIISDSTGNNNNKVANTWSDCYCDDEAFPNLVNMERSDIQGTTNLL